MEALLVGHEDWVFSVAWQPQQDAQAQQAAAAPCLLSASMDRTMMLWRPESTSGAEDSHLLKSTANGMPRDSLHY